MGFEWPRRGSFDIPGNRIMAHRGPLALEGIFGGFTPAVQRPGDTGALEPEGFSRPVAGKLR